VAKSVENAPNHAKKSCSDLGVPTSLAMVLKSCQSRQVDLIESQQSKMVASKIAVKIAVAWKDCSCMRASLETLLKVSRAEIMLLGKVHCD
jgi:hypothetical protein